MKHYRPWLFSPKLTPTTRQPFPYFMKETEGHDNKDVYGGSAWRPISQACVIFMTPLKRTFLKTVRLFLWFPANIRSVEEITSKSQTKHDTCTWIKDMGTIWAHELSAVWDYNSRCWFPVKQRPRNDIWNRDIPHKVRVPQYGETTQHSEDSYHL